MWTKLLENLLLAKHLMSVAATLIFVQFEANSIQNKFKYKFCNNINFENVLTLFLMSSFSTGYIKQSTRSHTNVNWDNSKVMNVISATNDVKHNTRKELVYDIRVLLKIGFWEKDHFINDDVTPSLVCLKWCKLWKLRKLTEINRK